MINNNNNKVTIYSMKRGAQFNEKDKNKTMTHWALEY